MDGAANSSNRDAVAHVFRNVIAASKQQFKKAILNAKLLGVSVLHSAQLAQARAVSRGSRLSSPSTPTSGRV